MARLCPRPIHPALVLPWPSSRNVDACHVTSIGRRSVSTSSLALHSSPKDRARFYFLGQVAQNTALCAELLQKPTPPPITILTPWRNVNEAFHRLGKSLIIEHEETGAKVAIPGAECEWYSTPLKGIPPDSMPSPTIQSKDIIWNLVIKGDADWLLLNLKLLKHRITWQTTITVLAIGMDLPLKFWDTIWPEPDTRPNFISAYHTGSRYKAADSKAVLAFTSMKEAANWYRGHPRQRLLEATPERAFKLLFGPVYNMLAPGLVMSPLVNYPSDESREKYALRQRLAQHTYAHFQTLPNLSCRIASWEDYQYRLFRRILSQSVTDPMITITEQTMDEIWLDPTCRKFCIEQLEETKTVLKQFISPTQALQWSAPPKDLLSLGFEANRKHAAGRDESSLTYIPDMLQSTLNGETKYLAGTNKWILNIAAERGIACPKIEDIVQQVGSKAADARKVLEAKKEKQEKEREMRNEKRKQVRMEAWEERERMREERKKERSGTSSKIEKFAMPSIPPTGTQKQKGYLVEEED